MDISQLNDAQQGAVRETEGAVLILAGAGSGKTRVLTNRIAWILAEGRAKPWQILALTFTNKAAREMKERIGHLVQAGLSDMWVGTFHSIFARILRREAEFIGYGRNFTIYDSDDQLKLIKDCMDRLQLKSGQLNPKRIRSNISAAKNAMLDPEAFLAQDSGFIHEQIAEVYREYAIQLKQANAMDFDDLLIRPIELFQQHPGRLEIYRDRFRYILIDEYQDTNRAQFEVTRLLAAPRNNICVVGDDDQSIYGWRGADISNILDFEESWPDVKVFKLEQNYRSTETILNAAHSVVSRNETRKPKKLWTRNGKGERIPILRGEDEGMEAALVCSRIRKHVEAGGTFKQCAILYRTNAQSRALEEACMRNGIRYQIVGGTRFYERREIKDLLAYLRMLVNPSDLMSLLRVINVPRRGIGGVTVDRLRLLAAQRSCTLEEALRIAGQAEGLGAAVAKRVTDFGAMLKRYRDTVDEKKPSELLEELIEEIGFIESLEAEGLEGVPRIENVRELQGAIQHYEENSELGLAGFLQEVALVSDVDGWNDQDDHVTMMTIHSAKGLEFPVVFVTGLEEGLFPLAGAMDDPSELEEERRLFYVAATRAMKHLYLCHADMRRRYGQAGGSIPSSFLDMIHPELLDRPRQESRLSMGGHFKDVIAGLDRGGFRPSVRPGRDTNQRRGRVDRPQQAGFSGGELELDPPAPSFNPKPRQGKPPKRESYEDKQRSALRDQYSPFRGGGMPDYENESQLPDLAQPTDLRPGTTVMHGKYGRGVVIHTVGFGGEMRVSVRFDSVGVKKMVARMAKLRLVG